MDKTGIEIVGEQYWRWIVNYDCPKEFLKNFEEECDKAFNGKIGKYLFFSKNREELIELAKTLLLTFNLHHAKTPSRLSQGYTEYVLCVYDVGPNHADDMKQYETENISYNGWKSDEATMKGVEEHEL